MTYACLVHLRLGKSKDMITLLNCFFFFFLYVSVTCCCCIVCANLTLVNIVTLFWDHYCKRKLNCIYCHYKAVKITGAVYESWYSNRSCCVDISVQSTALLLRSLKVLLAFCTAKPGGASASESRSRRASRSLGHKPLPAPSGPRPLPLGWLTRLL